MVSVTVATEVDVAVEVALAYVYWKCWCTTQFDNGYTGAVVTAAGQ